MYICNNALLEALSAVQSDGVYHFMTHQNTQHHQTNQNLTSFRLASHKVANRIVGTSHEKSKRAIKAVQHRAYQLRDPTVTSVTPRDAGHSTFIICTQEASAALKFWDRSPQPPALGTYRHNGCPD
jgi:hypothetical protein